MAGPMGRPGRGGAPVAKSGAPRPAAGGARAEHREPHGRGDVGRARLDAGGAEMHRRTGDPRWADAWAGRPSAVWTRWVGRWGSDLDAAALRPRRRSTSARPMASPATSPPWRGAPAVRPRPAASWSGGRCGRPPRRRADGERLAALAADGRPARPPCGRIRVQWCHGAPGMVTSLGSMAPGDDAFTALLVAGGRADWLAGPLASGARGCATARPATGWPSWRFTRAPPMPAGWSGRGVRGALPSSRSTPTGGARHGDTRCGPAIPAPRCTCAVASSPRQGSGSTSAAGEAADPAVQAQPAWRFPWASQGIRIGPRSSLLSMIRSVRCIATGFSPPTPVLNGE